MRPADDDDLLRAAAVAYVERLDEATGGHVPSRDLQAFEFEGRRIPLVVQKGIQTPQGRTAALTIRTTYRARPEDLPYQDEIGEDGYPRYKWRGEDPNHFDNRALREAMQLGKPLIWLRGLAPGVYQPIYPVWIVDEESKAQQFVLALTFAMREQRDAGQLEHPVDLVLRRDYAMRIVRERLHQPLFREQVLAAYRSQCALCKLRHPELLDAAHIREDADGGEPVLPNGIAMCAIHHRAFDRLVIGIRPDYVLEVRGDVLEESDGPTLTHSLQGLHGSELELPRRQVDQPDAELLEERYGRFRQAG